MRPFWQRVRASWFVKHLAKHLKLARQHPAHYIAAAAVMFVLICIGQRELATLLQIVADAIIETGIESDV